jgi:hypothetical protein
MFLYYWYYWIMLRLAGPSDSGAHYAYAPVTDPASYTSGLCFTSGARRLFWLRANRPYQSNRMTTWPIRPACTFYNATSLTSP